MGGPSVVRKLSQLNDPENRSPSKNKKARLDVEVIEISEDEDEEKDEEEDEEDTLPAAVKGRLEYIESHTENLTNTYLRMIIGELDHYMGSRGGNNAQVADEIVQHCRIMAYNGRSNLLEEKRAVHQAYSACWGGCAGDIDDDPDFYDVSQAVRDRVQVCMELMDELPEEELVKVMKALKTYKGPLDGEDMVGDITDHLDELATKRHDIVAEEEIIRGIYDEYNSEDPEIPKEVQSRLDSIHFLLSNLSKGFLQDVRKEFKKSSGYYGSATGTNKELTQGLYDHCQKLAEGGADLEDEEGIVEGIYKQCYRE